MADAQLNDKTSIRLTISSWWHVGVILVVIVGCYYGLKADTEQALTLSKETAEEQKREQAGINDMRMDIRSVTDDVKWFRQQYERDMSRYVRENNDKGGR